MLRAFASDPAAASQSAFNPANVADACVFALQTACRAVRPSEATSFSATMIVDLALVRQMADVYTARGITVDGAREGTQCRNTVPFGDRGRAIQGFGGGSGCLG
jgi:hypothetical protein